MNIKPTQEEKAQFHKEIACFEAQRHIEDCPECRKVLRELLEEEEMARKAEPYN